MGTVTNTQTLIEPHWTDAHRAAHNIAQPVSTVTISVAHATGEALAHPIRSHTNLPRDNTSAMDGWAVAHPQGPWRIIDQPALAGHVSQVELGAGEAVLIATGGVVPSGTFGVVRREFARVVDRDGAQWVEALDAREPFDQSHVRPAGAEAQLGETLVDAGVRLSPAHVGLAAMAGVDTVVVRRPVSVDILILGDEVIHFGVPGVGEVRDAFAPQFPAYARALGLQVGNVRCVPDTLEATVAAISGSEADVVITTGGTAAGPRDHVHTALAQVGAELVVDSIAMRPGHPNLLARRGEQFIVGLPGNPLSASLGGMLTLVRPLVCGLLGLPLPVLGEVVALADVHAPACDTRLVPCSLAWVDARRVGREMQWLGSGMMRGLAGADGVMVVPPGGVKAGSVVPLLDFPW